MASTTRKRAKPPAPVAEIDDSFARVMARACLAAADQIQERSITQLSVQWERNTADGFEQTLKSSRDDYGVVGEVHRKAIPERRWQVFYNRQTATYRLEEIEPELIPEAKPAPAPPARAPRRREPEPVPEAKPEPALPARASRRREPEPPARAPRRRERAAS